MGYRKGDVDTIILVLAAQNGNEEQIEQLAAYAHSAWAGWMNYMFSKCAFNEDGSAVVPQWAVERWQRQASTNYADLPEHEKTSDRKEAQAIMILTATTTAKT